jgi:UDP-N-acetylglucosamine diphosphorylase / glucose-1-phosphate thymidylyltransferase / UDP-N-acetylgalactosamine diphosphorylase / glucosamine-1-phosphate N-acetyltransferase / galactosamine-1-phosphate N-acetyltransferase
MQAVILAAGRGSRLQVLTLERSKAMLPIAGKPITARVTDMLTACGIHDFVIVAHPDDRDLLAHFAGKAQFVFQPERKGMADALLKAAPFIKGDFILTACDNLVETEDAQRLVTRFRAEKPAALLTLMRVTPEKISASGVVELDGDKIRQIVEKPRPEEAPSDMISLPLYCFSTEILAFLPKVQPSKRGEYELQDAIGMLIEAGKDVRGEIFPGRKTLTNAGDLLRLNLHYLSIEKHAEFNGIKAKVSLKPPFLVEAGADVAENCLIGPNVFVETSAKIGKGAVLRNAVILRNARVAAGAVIENQVIA